MKRSTWRWPWQRPEPDPVRPPKVGGTRAPGTVHEIDFTKPHDFHFRFGYNKDTPITFRRCVLVGYTTPMNGAGDREGFDEYGHNRWLVLRQEDGRIAYVPRDALLYIEEPRPENASSGGPARQPS